MKLSPNFTYNEAIRSNTAREKGIDNTPSIKETIAITITANEMQCVRSVLGDMVITPSSWYRSIELNRELGSKDTSDHILGKAVDFTVDGLTNREAFDLILDSNVAYKQMILEYEFEPNGWIHISFPQIGEQAERENLTASRNKNGKTIYTKV